MGSSPPKTSGIYPGRAETFVIDLPPRPREAERSYMLNGRQCQDWERPVLDRAYARLEAWDAQTVTVANRCDD